jgi:hypothetical protein
MLGRNCLREYSHITIYHDDNISDSLALYYAREVIGKGKISHRTIDGKIVHHYCWLTTFKDIFVETIPQNTSYQKGISFYVGKESEG